MARWENKSGTLLSRTQLPLTLAWGITIHKSQGLTLEKVVVELGHADFSPGLSFVAISCVKSLASLALCVRITCAPQKGGIRFAPLVNFRVGKHDAGIHHNDGI